MKRHAMHKLIGMTDRTGPL